MPDPIQIKRADVAEQIRALAALTGVSLTDAVGNAVKAQLAVERVKASRKLSKRMAQAAEALAELRRLPVVGPALSDRDLYGADGLPR
jgi:hypothetical protein